jgi:pimeloyl-ACP methyl ester carboxylesterase
MHVTRCGSGNPILFIHGMPGMWKSIVEGLCGRSTRLAVDLPGMGNSPLPSREQSLCLGCHLLPQTGKISIE